MTDTFEITEEVASKDEIDLLIDKIIPSLQNEPMANVVVALLALVILGMNPRLDPGKLAFIIEQTSLYAATLVGKLSTEELNQVDGMIIPANARNN